ncbi:MAG: AMP-binding protein [Lachnospiraceae bacterium]|nr:AMP-binding protein [Lachnospiraceae bacterium]MDE6699163.1 AMP-binding protein [Lachnospiraceae bacterium]
MKSLTNILEYLENTVKTYGEKVAYTDGENAMTFNSLYDNARAVGTALANKNCYKEPIIVFMDKSPETVAAFMGVIYSGNYYVPIDEEMPKSRIDLIISGLNPKQIICQKNIADRIEEFTDCKNILIYEELIKEEISEEILSDIRGKQLDTDPIYIVFTSGSTGIPKGVIACHRSVIDYIETLSEVLEVSDETVFGNQTPLYVDACLKEVYTTMKYGATTYFIPKQLFMMPVKLVEYLNEYKINTVCWVVPALTIISGLGAFAKAVPQYLKVIAFGSEVFPVKQFKLWKQYVPDAKYINLYGPTEATGMSCYYIVDRDFDEADAIPIGRPFRNTEIMLVDDENRLITQKDKAGEIYIRGTAVTLGYYNDFERTSKSFVQNPLNNKYPEIVYKTGDLAKYNEYGELIYISRRDHQIKHMGHRIELGEIEAAVNQFEGVNAGCCVYDEDKKKIYLVYQGEADVATVVEKLKDKLPRYMIPSSVKSMETLPLTLNGKIDRVKIKNEIIKRK